MVFAQSQTPLSKVILVAALPSLLITRNESTTSCGSEEENERRSLKGLKLPVIFTVWITFCVIINNFRRTGHIAASERWDFTL